MLRDEIVSDLVHFTGQDLLPRGKVTNSWKFACKPQVSISYQSKSLKSGPVGIFLDLFLALKQHLHKTWVYLQIDSDA